MNYKDNNEIDRMKSLIKYGMNESVQTNTGVLSPRVEYSTKGADGKTYGIIRECNKFYIKVAPVKDTAIVAEDYDYIGGYMNKKENEFSTYTMASKQFDLKLMSINEAFENKQKVQQFKPVQQADWQINETREMRSEIERFKQITGNVNAILSEDKSGFTMNHTLPEAPASHPSDKQVNSPFTDTAVANGDKDFKKTETNYEKAGEPFTKDGEVSNKDMESDKKPTGNTDATYTEKAKYVPENSVADKNPSGGKVVKVNEGKRTIRLTEEQVLAWNKSKDFMDKTNGTEIGSSAPFTDEVGKESNQTEAPTEKIHEEADVVHNTDNQNSPTPGTSEVGDTAPFDKKVNEEAIDVTDVAGMPDENDVPFPDVADGGSYMDFEDDYNQWLDDNENNTPYLDDEDFMFSDDALTAAQSDYESEYGDAFESVKRNLVQKITEDVLNDFGKHPAYRKKPMTLPPNKEVAKNGARDWNDKSVEGEKPFGSEIGDSAPFSDEVVSFLTDAIMKKLNFQKKA